MEWGCHDLTCRRGEAVVLERVTLALRAGEAIVLRGPNGSGKTTLLRTLAGLTPPVAGTVGFGADLVAYGGHADGLKDQLTVSENLRVWADLYGTGRDGAERAAAAYDLAPLAERRAADLSAGQRRRASLARMVATGRPVWLLDEPTVSLDAAQVARFAAAVRAHLEAGGAAVIATHIDLGLGAVREVDVSAFAARRAVAVAHDPFAEAVE
ncbi:heme ABC exporter ATP-binding protein CcmA [Jannaschia sp. Os4]|uniref:heme ABC exporter ATP-binding protein CcmA n=1 Tax=Jannaschia sp. Os4 TaxID=2807617 RepID=UPI00193A2F69|nr:heme ABC exporter ATP-binding protein CcmA [Jannaschia sp. Os4]MBM2577890.1 heme ABC exporter ATP-binding protein CcmA [Jannaschia sp. Os4]